MAVSSHTPTAPFRLGMLLYDRRYRSYTIQIVALIVLLLALSWLVNNAIENLARLGKEFNFNFLWTTANYEITPTLVEYSSTSTHFRAALVGFLNTIAVAIPGWFLATFIGVIVGVLRLSKSWITARLTTVYIEVLRNVPVVIWLVIIYGIVTKVVPQPNEFRGETPTASMIFESIAITNRGTYFPVPFMGWQLLVFIGVLVASVVTALYIRRRGIRQLEENGVAPPAAWMIAAIAIVPTVLLLLAGSGASYFFGTIIRIALWALVLGGTWIALGRLTSVLSLSDASAGFVKYTGLVLAVLLWGQFVAPMIYGSIFPALGIATDYNLFIPADYPTLTGFNFQGGLQLPNSYIALLVGLSVYTSSYIAENVRAGIQAISKGQTEAAYSLGLRPGRTMNLIVLPQALRIIVPPLISQWLNLTKNTSLGIFVTYTELKATLGGITMNQTGRELECNFLMMGIYLTLSLLISAMLNIYNQAVRLKER